MYKIGALQTKHGTGRIDYKNKKFKFLFHTILKKSIYNF